MMYKSVLNVVLFHTKLEKCPHCHYRQVYSSLSFVVPVILFTLVYNIPKFFELSTEVKKLKTNKYRWEILRRHQVIKDGKLWVKLWVKTTLPLSRVSLIILLDITGISNAVKRRLPLVVVSEAGRSSGDRKIKSHCHGGLSPSNNYTGYFRAESVSFSPL